MTDSISSAGHCIVSELEQYESNEYLVCFYDVLGQREWMNTAVKDGKIDPSKQYELNLIASSTNRACQSVRDRIKEFAAHEALNLVEGKDFGVQQFSDSTVIYVSKSLESAPGLFSLILEDVAFHSLEWQSVGLCIRGAVTVGLVLPVKGGTYCGPALDEAVELESHTAFHQRIVFSDRFVQWVERGIRCSKTSPKKKDGFLALKSMMQWEPDAECSLNIFSPSIPFRFRQEGKLDVYRRIYFAAKKRVQDALWNSGKKYAWKYFFTNDSYDLHERYLDEFLKGEPISAPLPPKELPNIDVGRYFVCYLKLLPLYSLPVNHNALKSDNCKVGYSSASGETIGLLQVQLQILSQWREKQCDAIASGVELGIQQIGNYIMVYVRDCAAKAFSVFMNAVHDLEPFSLFALEYSHFVEGSLVYGDGWTISKDCLCGPVVGVADEWATKSVPYPRILISDDMQKVFRDRLNISWQSRILPEIDGCKSWDVYSADMIAFLEQNDMDVDAFIRKVLKGLLFRQLYMWNFKFRSNNDSLFARQLAILLIVMRGNLEVWGKADLIKTAEEDAITEFKAIYDVAPGEEPWIVRRYAAVPDFDTRTGMPVRKLIASPDGKGIGVFLERAHPQFPIMKVK